jgi:hypothetical protein
MCAPVVSFLFSPSVPVGQTSTRPAMAWLPMGLFQRMENFCLFLEGMSRHATAPPPALLGLRQAKQRSESLDAKSANYDERAIG